MELSPDSFRETVVTAKAARRLRDGHLWVYSSDVREEPEPGDSVIVRVSDVRNHFLGYAFYSPQSRIRLRMITSAEDPPDRALFSARIKAAIERRRMMIGTGNACRLVFGESDLLPSIIVDRYDEYLVLQTLSFGSDALKPLLVEILRDLLLPKGIVERNDVKARYLEGLPESRGVLDGDVPDQVEICEGDLRFHVSLMSGQKTGFFLDQRENRLAAREFSSGRALDCFTNTGAFALHFAKHCSHVMAIDVSDDSLRRAEENARLNETQIQFVHGNVFDWLRELEREGRTFETICLDPPAFAKNRNALQGARAGYKEINLRAMKLLSPEGVLITSSCSYHLSEADFFLLLHEASRDARRYIQVIDRRSQAKDHPVLSGMPETHYLKCFILRVI